MVLSQDLSLLSKLTQRSQVKKAWRWLCQQRQFYPADADIWHLRFFKALLLPKIFQALKAGTYRLSAIQQVYKHNGESILLWCAQDALILKCLTLLLAPLLPCHNQCYHLKGHGGAKQAVSQACKRLHTGRYGFVCRTDIKGYYAHIDKLRMLDMLTPFIPCPIILNLISQFLHYSIENGGNFYTPNKGICRGCSLSPLLGGFYLYPLDQYFASQQHLYYQRYMDDILIFARSRWHLRKAVRDLNHFLEGYGFEQHPDKTFIGKTEKSFDWLGYQLNHQGICGVAPRTLQKHREKLHRLYEQARCQKLTPSETRQRVVDYQHRWRHWLTAGINPCVRSDQIRPWDAFTPSGIPWRYSFVV